MDEAGFTGVAMEADRVLTIGADDVNRWIDAHAIQRPRERAPGKRECVGEDDATGMTTRRGMVVGGGAGEWRGAGGGPLMRNTERRPVSARKINAQLEED